MDAVSLKILFANLCIQPLRIFREALLLRRRDCAELFLFRHAPDVEEARADPFAEGGLCEKPLVDREGGLFRLHKDDFHRMADEGEDQLRIMRGDAREADAGMRNADVLALRREVEKCRHQMALGDRKSVV